jgi:predicted O-linked N-acetylglucosamine transferase (SPINDLY family)
VTVHYSADYSPEQCFAEHLAWARRHEEPINAQYSERPFDNNRDANRPLRIGYLSGDFRDHPIARFVLPLLSAHDRAHVAVYCYSDVSRPDPQTERFQSRADVWRDVSAMDDDAVADAIRADRIDVLVDLAGHLDNRRLLIFARRPAPVQATCIGYSDTAGMQALGHAWRDIAGKPDPEVERIIRDDRIDLLIELAGHTAGNRLTLMARRPAPVQASYIGYPFTTGLDSIDWRITDSLTDPPGAADGHYTERLYRLARCGWCYSPSGPDETLPEVNDLPPDPTAASRLPP